MTEMRDNDATMTVTQVGVVPEPETLPTVPEARPEFRGAWWRQVEVTADMEALVASWSDATDECLTIEVEVWPEWSLTALVLAGDPDADFVASLRGVTL